MNSKEKNFEIRIKKHLSSKNAWYVKFFANAYTRSGIPDLLCCVNGKFVGIEVKQERGTPTDLQLYHLQKIVEAGGFGILAYPSGFDELKEILDDISNGNIQSWNSYVVCKNGKKEGG